jgi:hypothetical protein
MQHLRRQGGQALVELIVFFPLVIALAAAVFSMALYVQTKTLTVNTARFAAWERSVYADPAHLWSGDEAFEGGPGNATVHATARRDDHAIFGDGLAYLSTPGIRVRSDAHIGAMQASIAGATSGAGSQSRSSVLMWGEDRLENRDEGGRNVGNFVRDVSSLVNNGNGSQAASGLKAIDSAAAGESHWDETSADVVADSLEDLSGTPIANEGHKLPRDMMVRKTVSLSVDNVFRDRGWAVGLLKFAGNGSAPSLTMTSTAGLYVNSWAPKNEETFIRKVGGLDVEPFVSGATFIHSQAKQGLDAAIGGDNTQRMRTMIPILGQFFIMPGGPNLQPSSSVQLITRSVPGGNPGYDRFPESHGGLE